MFAINFQNLNLPISITLEPGKERKGNSAFGISGSGVEKRVERRSGFEGIEIRIMIAS
jgi:hypothetical protein